MADLKIVKIYWEGQEGSSPLHIITYDDWGDEGTYKQYLTQDAADAAFTEHVFGIPVLKNPITGEFIGPLPKPVDFIAQCTKEITALHSITQAKLSSVPVIVQDDMPVISSLVVATEVLVEQVL